MRGNKLSTQGCRKQSQHCRQDLHLILKALNRKYFGFGKTLDVEVANTDATFQHLGAVSIGLGRGRVSTLADQHGAFPAQQVVAALHVASCVGHQIEERLYLAHIVQVIGGICKFVAVEERDNEMLVLVVQHRDNLLGIEEVALLDNPAGTLWLRGDVTVYHITCLVVVDAIDEGDEIAEQCFTFGERRGIDGFVRYGKILLVDGQCQVVQGEGKHIVPVVVGEQYSKFELVFK